MKVGQTEHLYGGISDQNSSMMALNQLRVCSCNCRGVKSSLQEIRELCQLNDFIFIQEHWLLPFELGILKNIHSSFLSTGKSAVDISTNVLVGRPYGDTALLFNRALSGFVTVVDTFDYINSCQI